MSYDKNEASEEFCNWAPNQMETLVSHRGQIWKLKRSQQVGIATVDRHEMKHKLPVFE